jgi:hypothetical protein
VTAPTFGEDVKGAAGFLLAGVPAPGAKPPAPPPPASKKPENK